MKKIILLLTLGILLFGCTQYGGGSGATTPNTSNTGEHGSATGAIKTIHIQNFAFSPAEITIKTGDTITWVNDDSVSHNIISSAFSSQSIPSGGTFTHKFSESAGTYAYHCGIHPSMQATVTVAG